MVHYSSIRFWHDENAKARVIDRLIALRKKLQSDIKKKRSTGSFLLATWNLRDFDSNKFGHGPRLDESYLYIAEIISVFDLVALQEINRNLKGLQKLKKLLGTDWDYIATDTTEGSGGNQERMAYLFNTKKINFANIAGEIVLPKGEQISRTPFVAAFQAGWFKFFLCTAHIFFGASSGQKYEKRVREIDTLAAFLKKRQAREAGDYIILGDFNIVSKTDKTMKALTKHGFEVPAGLMEVKSNLKGDKQYDQIALRVKNKMLEIDDSGVFDFEEVIFKDTAKDLKAYQQHFPEKNVKGKTPAEIKKYYHDKWRSFQISDHKPLWDEASG